MESSAKTIILICPGNLPRITFPTIVHPEKERIGNPARSVEVSKVGRVGKRRVLYSGAGFDRFSECATVDKGIRVMCSPRYRLTAGRTPTHSSPFDALIELPLMRNDANGRSWSGPDPQPETANDRLRCIPVVRGPKIDAHCGRCRDFPLSAIVAPCHGHNSVPRPAWRVPATE